MKLANKCHMLSNFITDKMDALTAIKVLTPSWYNEYNMSISEYLRNPNSEASYSFLRDAAENLVRQSEEKRNG